MGIGKRAVLHIGAHLPGRSRYNAKSGACCDQTKRCLQLPHLMHLAGAHIGLQQHVQNLIGIAGPRLSGIDNQLLVLQAGQRKRSGALGQTRVSGRRDNQPLLMQDGAYDARIGLTQAAKPQINPPPLSAREAAERTKARPTGCSAPVPFLAYD